MITPMLLKTLRESAPPGGKVLTVYLDTSPKRVIGRAFLLSYRDLCCALRDQIGEAEREAFDAAEAQGLRLLEREGPIAAPGLAIFASGAGYFYAVPLPRRPREEIYWEPRGHLLPLQSTLDELERAAIVLFDAERARLFTVYLGAIEEHDAIEDEALPHIHGGGWATLEESRISRRRDDRLLHHAKHAVAALTAMNRTHPFDRLLLAGPDEALAVLTHQLPAPLRRRLAGTLHLEMFVSDAEVLRRALPILETIERQAEVAMIDELLDAGRSDGAAVGVDSVFAALNAGLVHVLYVAESYVSTGGECPSCGRLVAGPGPCPSCDAPLRPVANLGERAVEQALSHGARVEIVSGDADALLLARGGLGAWIR
jgi:hypothetical protein